MFGNKLPKVAALKGAETITAEDLEAANQEIVAFGIAGVTLCLDTELETISASATELGQVKNTLTAKETRVTELEAKVTELEGKIAKKPGAAVVAPVAEDDVIQDTADDDAPYLTEVDREKARMLAEWK